MRAIQRRRIFLPLSVLTLLGMLTIALNLTAAPILPGARTRATIPDPTRSLKDITAVRLQVQPIAAAIVETGLTIPAIRQHWAERLRANSIEIVDDPTAPLLSLYINEIGDPAVPRAKGYVMTLHVIQSVTVNRVELSVEVPTFVYMIAGVEHKDRLADSVRDSARAMVDVFIRSVEVASRG